MKKILVVLYFLTATSLNANHRFSLFECKNFFADKNMRYEHIKNKDKVSVSISVNQTDDFDPSNISNYSQRKAGFTDWKEHNDVEIGYGLGTWGVIDKSSERTIIDFHVGGYHGLEEFHHINWYDKNGKQWYSYGVNHLSKRDNIVFNWKCEYSDGNYTDRSAEIYYGYVSSLNKHFAAIINVRRYYKVINPEF